MMVGRAPFDADSISGTLKNVLSYAAKDRRRTGLIRARTAFSLDTQAGPKRFALAFPWFFNASAADLIRKLLAPEPLSLRSSGTRATPFRVHRLRRARAA